jgi:thiol-disulfide isomerase/thioredoxin
VTGLWIVLATLAAATVAGLLLRARDGRIRDRGGKESSVPLPDAVADALDPDARVTLVQLSTTFCAPCRHARAVLSTLAERTEGLVHVDLDVTERPEVAHRLGVLRTPTTLAFDASGRELLRIDGVPKAAALHEALAPALT